MKRRKTVSVTPAMGASTVAGAMATVPIFRLAGKSFAAGTDEGETGVCAVRPATASGLSQIFCTPYSTSFRAPAMICGSAWCTSYGLAEKQAPQQEASPQRLKADAENTTVIAAVNRCATQRQNQGQVQRPGQTQPRNPTLAQETRKDEASIGRANPATKTKYLSSSAISRWKSEGESASC